MTFINEKISKEDIKKYRIYDVMKYIRSWTIDKERNIWLIHVKDESDHTATDGGYTGRSFWAIYWNDTLMKLSTQFIDGGGDDERKHGWSVKKLLKIDVPHEKEKYRKDILRDLVSAFMAYKDGGIYSAYENYDMTLEISKELKNG